MNLGGKVQQHLGRFQKNSGSALKIYPEASSAPEASNETDISSKDLSEEDPAEKESSKASKTNSSSEKTVPKVPPEVSKNGVSSAEIPEIGPKKAQKKVSL